MTTSRPRHRRRVPLSVSPDELQAARSRAGHVAWYAFLAFVTVLVISGVNWGSVTDFIRDAIRQGAEGAVESHIQDKDPK